MQDKIKDKFPEWCQDVVTKYELILGDDIDSLMCYFYQYFFMGRTVNYFIDWNYSQGQQKFYRAGKKVNGALGLDMNIEMGNTKCWDNHIVKFSNADTYNTNIANINIAKNVRNFNYTEKACVSSFITMLSYYNVDITKWTREQLLILCYIDGLYYPFTEGRSNFKPTAIKNLELLEYEFLVPFLEKELKKNKNIFVEMERQYKLKSKILVENGFLKTDIDLQGLSKIFNCKLELPTVELKPFKTMYKGKDVISKNQLKEKLKDANRCLFNFALTYKNSYVYSYVNKATISN